MKIKEKPGAILKYQKKKTIFSLTTLSREELDRIVDSNRFSTRSHIVETAISHFSKLNRQKQTELLLEAMKG